MGQTGTYLDYIPTGSLTACISVSPEVRPTKPVIRPQATFLIR